MRRHQQRRPAHRVTESDQLVLRRVDRARDGERVVAEQPPVDALARFPTRRRRVAPCPRWSIARLRNRSPNAAAIGA